MTLSIFRRTEPDKKRSEAPGAHVDDQDESVDVEALTEDSGSQTQDDEVASPVCKTYLETLYPENWSSRFDCMCELIVDRRDDPSDVVQVYKTLVEVLDAEILYVNPTARRMSFVCGIRDLGSFLGSLAEMP